MTWTRAYFAGWAVVACATPVVNVIAEPPAGSSEASSGAGLLEATVAELVSFARDVREEQRRVGARGKDLLAAHPSAIAYQKGCIPMQCICFPYWRSSRAVQARLLRSHWRDPGSKSRMQRREFASC